MHGVRTRHLSATPQRAEHEGPLLPGQLDLALAATPTNERAVGAASTGAPTLLRRYPLVARTEGPASTSRIGQRKSARDAAVPRQGRDVVADIVRPTGTSSRPLLMTVSDAAGMLRIGRRQTWELIWRGELPIVRLGPRTIRVHHAALDQFLLERSKPYGA